MILFEDHVYNADRCKGLDLSPRTTKLEKQLNVTKAGRNANHPQTFNFEKLAKDTIQNRSQIITDINTAITDIVTFSANLKWDSRYCQFLRDISQDIQDSSGTMQGGGPNLDKTTEILATLIASMSEHSESLKDRLDVQLDVVRNFVPYRNNVLTYYCGCYNLVAQADSNVNSTITATAGLNSIAMPTLAFATPLFLPPPFVAISITPPTRENHS